MVLLLKGSRTICATLVEGIMRNNSSNIFFEFGPVTQEMSFKRFIIWSSGSPPVWWSGTIYALWKEGIIGKIHVKLYVHFWKRVL